MTVLILIQMVLQLVGGWYANTNADGETYVGLVGVGKLEHHLPMTQVQQE